MILNLRLRIASIIASQDTPHHALAHGNAGALHKRCDAAIAVGPPRECRFLNHITESRFRFLRLAFLPIPIKAGAAHFP